MPDVEKTFGQAFGDLIRKKRGQEGLTQKELAIKAFDDESKVRRIIELENGAVKRPQIKTVDALVAYFNISEDELDGCRRYGLTSSSERSEIGLTRELIENLALRYEHDNPAASDFDLISFLKNKATELRLLKKRLSELENAVGALNNQIAAANDALEHGRFDEADDILAAAEEMQQEERTLKEIRAQSNIRFARGDAALFNGQSAVASAHYKKAAEYFAGFEKATVAEILSRAAGQIYEIERRSLKPQFENAIDLARSALELTEQLSNKPEWIRAKYCLALLQQVQSHKEASNSGELLNESIRNVEEALNTDGEIDDFDWAGLMMLRGNNYMARAERVENKGWKSDIDTAIKIFDAISKDRRLERLKMHRCRLYNNIAAAWSLKSRRSSQDNQSLYKESAKKALLRAIELSTQENQVDVWSAAQYNLGIDLAEAAAAADSQVAQFLRIQSIAAFSASLEAFPQTALGLQLAHTHLALGQVLLECARSSKSGVREAYLVRSIGEYEAAAYMLDKETHLGAWSHAQFSIGLAFFLHAEKAEPNVAVADLGNALSCFDAAEPGYRSLNERRDLKKLQSARTETKVRLQNLRQTLDTKPSA
jgi:transcriptional regulator with XRE-family HTH domain